MAKIGRPASGKYNIAEMTRIIIAYTDETDVPILKEVCYKNNWDYQYVMNLQAANEDLREPIKRLLDKKESDLERGGLTGKVDKTMAIFSLKQLGWRDKIEIEDSKDSDRLKALKSIFDGVKNGD